MCEDGEDTCAGDEFEVELKGSNSETQLWLQAQEGDLVVEGSGSNEINGVYKPSREGGYDGRSWWWKDGIDYRDGSRYGNPENFQVWHNGGQVR